MAYDSSSFNLDDPILDPTKDEACDEGQEREKSINNKIPFLNCPLTFDGAYGLSQAKHAVEHCLIEKCSKRHLLGHLKHMHKLKSIHAYRIYRAAQDGLDPTTTKLFGDTEVVIDYNRFVACPFTSGMINLIGCCPRNSQKIPCQTEVIDETCLKVHLRQYHRISSAAATRILKIYKTKLGIMKTADVNRTNFN